MEEAERSWGNGGRSPRWRAMMVLGGLAAAGCGATLLWRPQILVWIVAAAFFALGAGLVLSGLLARGR